MLQLESQQDSRLQLFVGQERQYSFYKSSIEKQPIKSGVVDKLGFKADHQSFEKHGGEGRALHHYPASNYQFWKNLYPKKADLFKPGSFGENICSWQKLDEENVCIGDIYKIGLLYVQVTQPRKPCFKLNKRFGLLDLKDQVEATSKCGWFYKVLNDCDTVLTEYDLISVVNKGDKEMTVRNVAMTIYPNHFDKSDQQFIQKCLDCKELDPEWKGYIIENNKNIEKVGDRAFFAVSFLFLILFVLFFLYSYFFNL